jgi:hypothetical protein
MTNIEDNEIDINSIKVYYSFFIIKEEIEIT